MTLIGIGCKNNDDNSGTGNPPPTPQTPSISYSVVSTQPHDTTYFTEGLEFYKGRLVESIGLPGKSKLIQYDLANGKVDKEVKLDSMYFGEGITIFRDTIYQLTYREGVVHVYDAKTFKKIKQLPYNNGEGWGLTHDSTYLIGNNGGNNLYFYEPGTFKLVKTLPVYENDTPAVNLNELEYVNGFIYANQWQYNTILKINPADGKVVAKMDLTDLYNRVKAEDPTADVLNGIGYNPLTKKIYITGKLWPHIYELQFAF